MKTRTINNIAIFLLVFLFFYTATVKLFKHSFVIISLRTAPIIGNYSTLLSWAIPGMEIVTAILLIIPKARGTGYIIAGCLLTAFTMYIVTMLAGKQNMPCPCGGVISGLSWPAHIFLNIFLIGVCVSGYKMHQLFYCNKTGNAENL